MMLSSSSNYQSSRKLQEDHFSFEWSDRGKHMMILCQCRYHSTILFQLSCVLIEVKSLSQNHCTAYSVMHINACICMRCIVVALQWLISHSKVSNFTSVIFLLTCSTCYVQKCWPIKNTIYLKISTMHLWRNNSVQHIHLFALRTDNVHANFLVVEQRWLWM